MKLFKYAAALLTLFTVTATSSVQAEVKVADIATQAVVSQLSEVVNKEQAVALIGHFAEPLKALPASAIEEMTLAQQASYQELMTAMDGFLYSQSHQLDNPVEEFYGVEFQQATNWLLVFLMIALFVGPTLLSEAISTYNGYKTKKKF